MKFISGVCQIWGRILLNFIIDFGLNTAHIGKNLTKTLIQSAKLD